MHPPAGETAVIQLYTRKLIWAVNPPNVGGVGKPPPPRVGGADVGGGPPPTGASSGLAMAQHLPEDTAVPAADDEHLREGGQSILERIKTQEAKRERNNSFKKSIDNGRRKKPGSQAVGGIW